MGAGGRALTPTAEAAATAGCPFQSRENGQIRERKRMYDFIRDRQMAQSHKHVLVCYLHLRTGADLDVQKTLKEEEKLTYEKMWKL